MWDFHDVKDSGLHDVHGPWMGNDLRSNSLRLIQLLVRFEHVVGLAVPKIIVIDIQGWNPLQIWSDYAYPLLEVRRDDHVV